MPVNDKTDKTTEWVDPLYQVFEHFLFTRTYDDSNAFTKEVATQYLSYLDATAGFIPSHVRKMIQEDLETEIHEMLVKKIYGFNEVPEEAPPHGVPKLSPPLKSSGSGDDHF